MNSEHIIDQMAGLLKAYPSSRKPDTFIEYEDPAEL